MRSTSTHRGALALFLVLAAGIFTVAYCAAADVNPQEWKAPARAARKKNPVPADADSIAAGKAVYSQNCLSCHGQLGRGDGPAAKDLDPKPHDLSDPKVVAQSDGALFWKITEGRKPMPTFEKLLGETDRWNVVNYIRTLAPATEPSSQPATQP
jgi:mono/diheme cytochrome c family protein